MHHQVLYEENEMKITFIHAITATQMRLRE